MKYISIAIVTLSFFIFSACGKTPQEDRFITVEMVTLDQSAIKLISGETFQLQVNIKPHNATNKSVIWVTSDKSVSTVDGAGNVTAIGVGTATITAMVADKIATCTVTVITDVIPVEEIELNQTSLTIAEGQSETLFVTISPSNATDKSVIWTSTNPSVAAVDKDGRVTAVSYGKVSITATTSDGGYTATCAVTVRRFEPEPEAVDLGLNVKWASFNLGASHPRDKGKYYAWGETQPKDSYSWATYKWYNEYVMTKYNGYDNKTEFKDYDYEDDAARANLGGKWRIPTDAEWAELLSRCTLSDGWWEDPVYGTRVTGPNGNSIFLPHEGYMSDADLTGIIDGWVPGGWYWSASLHRQDPYSAIICSRVQSDYSTICNYRCCGLSIRPVTDEGVTSVSGITLNKNEIALNPCETYSLTATVTYVNAIKPKNVNLYTSNASVATVGFVDGKVVVSAISAGIATIYARTSDGAYTATCAVTVGYSEPEAIDLGLSVKWASFNLGASVPEEYGGYYAWGAPQSRYDYIFDWNYYKWCNGSSRILTKYNTNSSYGSVDNKTTLELEDDAARVNLGGMWRIPTDEEWKELLKKCTWTRTTQNGINGRRVTGPNGNSIFLPAAGNRYGGGLFDAGSRGYYWSSSLNTDSSIDAWQAYFDSDSDFVGMSVENRYYGQSVRPVVE